MTVSPADPRLLPARGDIAARSLQGTVEADRFVDAEPCVVAHAAAPLTFQPDPSAEMASELIRGEAFAVYDRREGWAWGQSERDGYVGYVPEDALAAARAEPTHRVAVLSTHLYPAADIKRRSLGTMPFASLCVVEAADGRFARADGGYVLAHHLAPVDSAAPDWVAEAARFRGTPYLWGGRTPAGIDCSGLVQLALLTAGVACPRDSDMQEAALGQTIGAEQEPRRGDLIFWKGHVGFVSGPDRLLHANAHHMATVEEPLAAAIARIAEAGGGQPTRRARLDPGPAAG